MHQESPLGLRVQAPHPVQEVGAPQAWHLLVGEHQGHLARPLEGLQRPLGRAMAANLVVGAVALLELANQAAERLEVIVDGEDHGLRRHHLGGAPIVRMPD